MNVSYIAKTDRGPGRMRRERTREKTKTKMKMHGKKEGERYR